MQTTEVVDVRVAISEKLKKEGRTMVWLSESTGINYHTLYGILTYRHVNLSSDKLNKINEVLGTTFSK